jgi:hypothetical protein
MHALLFLPSTSPAHLILIDLIILTKIGEQYRSWSS